MDTGETFQEFIRRILSGSLDPRLVEMLVADKIQVQADPPLTANGPLNIYFRRAFTHETFQMGRLSVEENLNYEVLEKIGDRVLKAVFQLWLYDIMGKEINEPDPYAKMEIFYLDTFHLAELTEKLGFDRWIRVATGSIAEGTLDSNNTVTEKMKEDVFEGFIGALVLASDKFITPDIGFGLAKRWIYQVYNTYVRDQIDPTDTLKYIGYVTRVNEIWQFNDWGNQTYRTPGTFPGARELGLRGIKTIDLIGPKKSTVPEEFRGRVVGSGEGATLALAKEAAAKEALKNLGSPTARLEGSVVEFNLLNSARLDKLLQNMPALKAELRQVMRERSDIFTDVAVRDTKIHRQFVVQVRYRIDDKWVNGARERSTESYDDALTKAFRSFIDRVKRPNFKV